MKKHLIIGILFGYGLLCAAQENKLFFKRYHHKNDSIHITAHLRCLFEDISAYVSFNQNQLPPETVYLSGTYGENELAKLVSTETDLVLDARSNPFQVEINIPPSLDPIPLKEYYPKGSTKLNMYYLHSESPWDSNNPEGPSAEIELSWLQIADEPGLNIHSLNKLINEWFSKANSGYFRDSLLIKTEKDFHQLYQMSYPEGHSMVPDWQKTIMCEVLMNENDLLCVEKSTYVYTGGTSGLSSVEYRILDTKELRFLKLKDLFTVPESAQLTRLLTDHIKEQLELDKNSRLIDYGFFSDSVSAHENFYLTTSGIGFYYNSYEIAPRGQGSFRIWLDAYEVTQVLTKKAKSIFKSNQATEKPYQN